MWLQLLIGIGGLVFLATVFAAFQELGNRRRMLEGECRMDSIRCLGCLATGRCRAQQSGASLQSGRKGAKTHSSIHSR